MNGINLRLPNAWGNSLKYILLAVCLKTLFNVKKYERKTS